ncbi:hypothetical protein [Enterococcus sp. HY326]|uniref:hypothetical protein n=1 Tax=Enterococcus sp. HY326 TaxID=2971265 RepID=UPI00223EB6BD|nr:hypothetical protein [Enterococcus sp. HY326]
MKKIVLLCGLVLLAGCSTENNQETATTEEASVSNEISSTSTNDSTTISSSSENTVAEDTSALAELQQQYPSQLFPTDIPYDSTNFLNIAADIEANHVSVLYYQLPQAYVLNDHHLNDAQPLAAFKQDNFSTTAEAQAAVSKIPADGASQVDLGSNITGFLEGAAGSTYLAWDEGNWSFNIRANNNANQDPVPIAKEIVNYLETALLPAPDTDGQVTIDMAVSDYTMTAISWQEGTVVYTIENFNYLNGLKMAVSMAN